MKKESNLFSPKLTKWAKVKYLKNTIPLFPEIYAECRSSLCQFSGLKVLLSINTGPLVVVLLLLLPATATTTTTTDTTADAKLNKKLF